MVRHPVLSALAQAPFWILIFTMPLGHLALFLLVPAALATGPLCTRLGLPLRVSAIGFTTAQPVGPTPKQAPMF
jgi:hypothetical protein